MSNNKLTPLQVIERYHERYLEYEAAFNKNPFSEKQRQEEILKLAKSDIDLESQEFLDKMVELFIDKAHKMADVNNAALKFIMFVDFYILTQEEDLPDNIMKDYNSLPIKDNIKSYFSIKDGDFVKNEEFVIDDEIKNEFKAMIEHIKNSV